MGSKFDAHRLRTICQLQHEEALLIYFVVTWSKQPGKPLK